MTVRAARISGAPDHGVKDDIKSRDNRSMIRSARRLAAYLVLTNAPPLPSLGTITSLPRRLRRLRINPNPGAMLVDIAGADAVRISQK